MAIKVTATKSRNDPESSADPLPTTERVARSFPRRTGEGSIAPMYDVIIAGYGPTGMLAAILLGRAGHKVCVLERYSTLYNLPRVGIVHDDIQRMFQEIGILDRVQPAM